MQAMQDIRNHPGFKFPHMASQFRLEDDQPIEILMRAGNISTRDITQVAEALMAPGAG
jgi:hypothetical protein